MANQVHVHIIRRCRMYVFNVSTTFFKHVHAYVRMYVPACVRAYVCTYVHTYMRKIHVRICRVESALGMYPGSASWISVGMVVTVGTARMGPSESGLHSGGSQELLLTFPF